MGYDFWGSIFRRLLGRRTAVPVAVLRGSAFKTVYLYCMGLSFLLVRSRVGSTYV